MGKHDDIIGSTLVILCILGISAVILFSRDNQFQKFKNFEDNILPEGLEIIKGTIESPSVIIDLNRTEFLNKITELNSTTIYMTFEDGDSTIRNYFVFTEGYSIAYKLDSRFILED